MNGVSGIFFPKLDNFGRRRGDGRGAKIYIITLNMRKSTPSFPPHKVIRPQWGYTHLTALNVTLPIPTPAQSEWFSKGT